MHQQAIIEIDTVTLSKEERDELQEIVKRSKRKMQTIRNALIFLNCDEGEHGDKVKNEKIAKVLKIGARTIERMQELN